MQPYEEKPDAAAIFEGLVDWDWPETVCSLFYEHCLCGPMRTLRKTYDIVLEKWPEVGLTLSLDTLRDISWKYKWSEKVREYDRRAYMWTAESVLMRNHEMNLRHARIGMETLEIAAENVRILANTGNLGGTASVQLLKNAAEVERLANEAELSRETVSTTPVINITISTDDSTPALPERIVDAGND